MKLIEIPTFSLSIVYKDFRPKTWWKSHVKWPVSKRRKSDSETENHNLFNTIDRYIYIQHTKNWLSTWNVHIAAEYENEMEKWKKELKWNEKITKNTLWNLKEVDHLIPIQRIWFQSEIENKCRKQKHGLQNEWIRFK